MNAPKIEQSLRNLEQAVLRLKEALDEPQTNPLAVDGVIQRFEFVFELNWKTLKHMLEAEGVFAGTPRAVIREAYKVQWIEDEAAWLQMLSDRNDTSHTYNEATARRIYENIRNNFPVLSGSAASYRVRVNARP
ncbi:MAG: nucleotidyltransferase substrate binding protein [Alphaproteobacteria bacterium]